MVRTLFILSLVMLLGIPGTTEAATLTRPQNNLGLSAYWSFDQGTSTRVVDQSGKGHALTLTTSGSVLPTWITGRYGKGLTFDGSTNYATIPTVTDLSFPDQTFTVSYWIKETSATGTFVMANGAVSGGWGVRDDGAVFLKNVSNNQNTYSMSGATLADNKWHHVVYVITTSTTVAANNTVTAYVDGASVSMSGTPTVTYSPHTNFSIGNRNSSSNPWAGSIDEVRIYGRGLSATEISGLYRKGQVAVKNVSRSGLVGEWKFDEGTSTDAGDSSGFKNSAALVNAPLWVTGKHGKAVLLDGNTQYATIPNASSLNNGSLTASMWFTLSADPECDAGNNYRIFLNKLNGVTGWRVILEQDKSLQFDVGIGGVVSRSGGKNVGMQVGVPVFVTFTYDASTGDQKVWANGVALPTKTNTPAPIDSNSDSIGVGKGGATGLCPASGNGYVPGAYDDLRIYSRALSAAEIYALYRERTVSINSSQNTKVTNGLIGVWSFDGADLQGTTAYDRSGSGNNGTLVNSPKKSIGKIGQALQLTGNNYVNTSVSAPVSAYSKSAWVKVASCSNTNNIVSSTGNATALFAPSSYTCKLSSGHNGSWMQVQDSTALTPGVWYFVSVTYDSSVAGGTLKLYKNGALVNSATSIAAPATGAVQIGAHGGGNFLTGSIDDARLYNRALTDAEVEQLYLMGK